ncbi:hypothetical protein GA0115239_12505 [Streptomyces sp. BpilaLS-43]|nr:hypothetical protein GA0115239_12505 [Streptomyces sp. BpilaLS-43]
MPIPGARAPRTEDDDVSTSRTHRATGTTRRRTARPSGWPFALGREPAAYRAARSRRPSAAPTAAHGTAAGRRRRAERGRGRDLHHPVLRSAPVRKPPGGARRFGGAGRRGGGRGLPRCAPCLRRRPRPLSRPAAYRCGAPGRVAEDRGAAPRRSPRHAPAGHAGRAPRGGRLRPARTGHGPGARRGRGRRRRGVAALQQRRERTEGRGVRQPRAAAPVPRAPGDPDPGRTGTRGGGPRPRSRASSTSTTWPPASAGTPRTSRCSAEPSRGGSGAARSA